MPRTDIGLIAFPFVAMMTENADENDNRRTECTFPPGSRRVKYEDLDPAQKNSNISSQL